MGAKPTQDELPPEQEAWLRELGAKLEEQDEADKRQKLKSAMLAQLISDLGKNVSGLLLTKNDKDVVHLVHGGMDQRFMNEKTGAKGIAFATDEAEEFDLASQIEGMVLAADEKGKRADNFEGGRKEKKDKDDVFPEQSQEQYQKFEQARLVLELVTRQMHEAKVLDKNGEPLLDDDGKPIPLFTPEELEKELYTPLKRRRLLPDTFIPDEYSATKKMLDGSFAAYADRLSAEKKKGFFKENKDLIMAGIGGLASLGAAGSGMNEAITQSADKLQSSADAGVNIATKSDKYSAGGMEAAPLALEHTESGIHIFFEDVVEGALDTKEALEQNKEQKAARKVPVLAIAAVAKSLGDAFNPYGLGVNASTTYSTKVNPSEIKQLFREDAEKAVVTLGEGFAETVNTLVPAAKQANPFDDKLAALVGKHLEDDKPVEALTAINGAATHAAKDLTSALKNVLKDKQAIKDAEDNAVKAVCEAFEKNDSPKPDKKDIKRHNDHHKHEPQWVETGQGFKCLECLAHEKPDNEAELFEGIIERKIEELERDKKIWDWVTKLGGMGFDVASNFVAPLAIGGALLKMAKNANEAFKRRKDAAAFATTRGAMIRAASAYSAPCERFLNDANLQFSHASFNAAMEGMKVLAAVLQLGLVTAPIGAGTSAAVTGAQAVEAVLWEANKRDQLDQAWVSYKRALEDPDNRKKHLGAMKVNPSLAKYAMAWGAVIEKDPLVQGFMRNCDLNADTLKDRGANVDKVAKYLAAKFPEDVEVIGRDYSQVGRVELTAQFWVKETSRAEKELNVRKQGAEDLELLLNRWAAPYASQKSAKAKNPEVVKALVDVIAKIKVEILKYEPFAEGQDKKGPKVVPMLIFRERFWKAADQAEAEVKGWQGELKATAAPGGAQAASAGGS